jgi:transcriptional regulator with XRE-family HTH domain
MEAYIESTRNYANELLERTRTCILAVKKARNYSYKDMANISGISEETIKNFCNRKTSKNAGYITIIILAMSLNIDLNELVGYTPKKETESLNTSPISKTPDTIEAIVKLYEERIEDVKALCELRVADVQKCCDLRIADIKQNCEERIAEQKNRN